MVYPGGHARWWKRASPLRFKAKLSLRRLAWGPLKVAPSMTFVSMRVGSGGPVPKWNCGFDLRGVGAGN